MRRMDTGVAGGVFERKVPGRGLREAVYGIVSLIMAAAIVLGFVLVVNGQTDRKQMEKDMYLKSRTAEYKSLVREYLEEESFHNAGVTLTYVTGEEDTRVYSVKLHHKRFASLSDIEKSYIEKDIEDMGFSCEGCSFEVILEQ
ncbi:MAG: hypothetical protein IJ796_09270 [Lachnospiraceae bacterium]|nr:hypothetical protein [Lachnospiraceae bacterium]